MRRRYNEKRSDHKWGGVVDEIIIGNESCLLVSKKKMQEISKKKGKHREKLGE